MIKGKISFTFILLDSSTSAWLAVALNGSGQQNAVLSILNQGVLLDKLKM